MNVDEELMQKALVSVSVEKTLLALGNPVYEKVIDKLKKEYHCYLTDCYEHPEYLHKVIMDLFGDGGNVITESIKNELKEFREYRSVARFLEIICK